MFDWLHLGAATVRRSARRLARSGLVGDLRSRVLFTLEVAAGCSIFAAELGLHDLIIPSELGFEICAVALIVHGDRRLGLNRSNQ